MPLFQSLTEFTYLDFYALCVLDSLRFDVLSPATNHLDQPLLLLQLQQPACPAYPEGLRQRNGGQSETIIRLRRSQYSKHARISCRTANNMPEGFEKQVKKNESN